ncbi:adaptin N terminal region-domain-containing protein [Phlyctochytrium arcticum]|nr:adaptin N terminal region-domain-containing protein [Phlyctochytrium arcticum]
MAQAARGPKFFSTTKKGENFELKADLNSEYREKRKETVKKVIANMTIGKDVSSLFADVVKNMQTEDLELKKLVYLYLINYARTQPELVILAVNTFVKDTDDINPLIRALAIRTMGMLRVEKIIDYLLEPLKKGLKDDDPYVRKTAALCVAKLYDLNPTIAIDNGLIVILQDLLSDRNPMVIANAVAALVEISEASVRKEAFFLNASVLTKLLAALNECTEWGQIGILNSLANYRPVDAREAADIAERILPRLQHANASVVLSAIRTLMIYLEFIQNDELSKQITRKLAPPLVTLLSSEPEIQYVALRNINLILQKRSDVLTQEIRVFFIKYNDPPYVKLEKLEVIIKLCAEKNVDQVVSELREYANEVDVDFVRKAVRAIGRCAVKIESASEKCVNTLLDLLKTKVSHVVQETIVVIKDIFRRYPGKYVGIIPALCEHLDSLDEPEAKASLIWIIGDYADRIDNAGELLNYFLEAFSEESAMVQLQIISAAVKLFLKKAGSAQDIVQTVLTTATQGCDNPDIRDRAYIYWRLLSSNPEAAKMVVLAEKPPIEDNNATVSESLLDDLLRNIGSLASVYHKSPSLLGGNASSFTSSKEHHELEGEEPEVDARTVAQQVSVAVGGGIENLLDLDFGGPSTDAPTPFSPGPPLSYQHSALDDLLGMANMESSSGGSADVQTRAVKTSLLTPDSSNGLEMQAGFTRRNQQLFMEISFKNHTKMPMNEFAIQFNTNSYGITPAGGLEVPEPLAPNQTADVVLPLTRSGGVQQMTPANMIQIAVKNNGGIYYCNAYIPEDLVN